MIEVRWHGRGGQGCWTAARLLGLAAAQFEGKHALSFPSFGPERRGAPVLGFTRISEQKIHDRSEVTTCDYIVVLDETLIGAGTGEGLKANGTVVINTRSAEQYESNFPGARLAAVDATSIALEILGRPIMNTSMLGALLAVSDIVSLESAKCAIKEEMRKSIQEKNIQVLKTAYDALRGTE
jgi:pyruvate ferredoxin oxidoreductase gamma subunit